MGNRWLELGEVASWSENPLVGEYEMSKTSPGAPQHIHPAPQGYREPFEKAAAKKKSGEVEGANTKGLWA